MLTPLPVANAALVLSSTLFAMALVTGLFIVQSALAVLLAGQLVGKAVKG